jgi:hypothetical protein
MSFSFFLSFLLLASLDEGVSSIANQAGGFNLKNYPDQHLFLRLVLGVDHQDEMTRSRDEETEYHVISGA